MPASLRVSCKLKRLQKQQLQTAHAAEVQDSIAAVQRNQRERVIAHCNLVYQLQHQCRAQQPSP